MPKSIFIESRFWFDRSGGNTYFSNRVWVDGAIAFQTGIEFGYGSQYETSAIDNLVAIGLLPVEQAGRPAYQIARNLGIHIYTVQSEVGKRLMFMPEPYSPTQKLGVKKKEGIK
jgi:hypothetical protein